MRWVSQLYDDIKPHSLFLEKPRCLAGETVEQLGDSYSPLSQFSQAIRIRGQKARGCADSGKTTMSVSIRRRGNQTKERSDEGAIRRRGNQTKGEIGKTTMSGSSSRTVHCPCGRVSECSGAETFLQHDAHQAASASFLKHFFL